MRYTFFSLSFTYSFWTFFHGSESGLRKKSLIRKKPGFETLHKRTGFATLLSRYTVGIVFRALRVSYCKAAFELSPSREFLSSSFPFLFKQNRRKIDILPGILIFILVIPFPEFDTVFTVGYADLNRR